MIVAVIPVYNEELTISGVVEKTKKHTDKIIVVDDGSTDDTFKLLKKEDVIIIHHKQNKGLGASLRHGLGKALETDADIIITVDGDGQHNPDQIPLFVKKIKQGHDFVLGNRDLRKYPFTKKFGNFFLNIITNFIAGTNLADTESGFRAFSRKGLKKLNLTADRYEIATEIVFEVGLRKLKTTNTNVQSPIYTKGVSVIDGFRNFIFLMRRREKSIKGYVHDLKYILKNKL